MSAFRPLCLVSAFALFIVCFQTRDASAQNSPVSVQWLSEGSFAVHVEGQAGSTQEDAGSMAMSRACEVARDRGYSHYGVNEFSSSTGTQNVLVAPGGTVYYGGPDGRPVEAHPTADQYQTVQFGRSLLNVTMMQAGSTDLLGGSMEIVDANTCLVYSRPR